MLVGELGFFVISLQFGRSDNQAMFWFVVLNEVNGDTTQKLSQAGCRLPLLIEQWTPDSFQDCSITASGYSSWTFWPDGPVLVGFAFRHMAGLAEGRDRSSLDRW